MSALLLFAFLAARPVMADGGTPRIAECVRVECTTECWTVAVRYRINTAAPGQPPQEMTAVDDDGPWGSLDGARCRAAQVAHNGMWREDVYVPGVEAELVAPGAVDLVQILERAF